MPDPNCDDTPRKLALRVMTMPRDTNPYGTIFGGVIMSYVDQAALIEALRHAHCTWVTASMERVDFIAPVHLGDTVELYTSTARIGTKSVSVCVEVDALRHDTAETVRVTTATVTMVALDRGGIPVAFKDAPPPRSHALLRGV
jgi:acyl-CoA thioesterase YciA